jgi:MFS family permease
VEPSPLPARSFGVVHAVRATFVSLRNRNFRLFFIGQTVSNTGNWLTTVALTLLVLKLTHSGLAVGELSACQFGPILFLSAWAGAIADRSDKRRMLLWTQSLEMTQSVGLATLAFMPHPPIAGLFVLAVGGGVLLSFDNPMRRSFVSEMVPREDLPNAVVLYSTIVNVSRMIGPALAGLLIITLGYGWCFTIDAASYLAVLLCIVLMRAGELHRQPPHPREKGEVRKGFAYVASSPVLGISFVMLLIVGTLTYNFGVTLPLFVTTSLKSSGAVFTVVYSVFSLGAVASALMVAHRRLVAMRHVVLGSTALGLATLTLAAAPSVAWALPVVFLVGATSIVYFTSTTAIVQLESEDAMHGRILSLQMVVIGGTTLIGGPLLGLVADVLGGRAPLIIGGVAALAAGGIGALALRRRLGRGTCPHETLEPQITSPPDR